MDIWFPGPARYPPAFTELECAMSSTIESAALAQRWKPPQAGRTRARWSEAAVKQPLSEANALEHDIADKPRGLFVRDQAGINYQVIEQRILQIRVEVLLHVTAPRSILAA